MSLSLRKIIAGYTDEASQKTSVTSPYLAPSGIILDAELTLATPEKLWSVTSRLYKASCTQCTQAIYRNTRA
jgi:hypothetical protein